MKPFFSSTPEGLKADVFDSTALEMQNKSSHTELKLAYSESSQLMTDVCMKHFLHFKQNVSRGKEDTRLSHLSLFEATC